jgi:hypothetical protein
MVLEAGTGRDVANLRSLPAIDNLPTLELSSSIIDDASVIKLRRNSADALVSFWYVVIRGLLSFATKDKSNVQKSPLHPLS